MASYTVPNEERLQEDLACFRSVLLSVSLHCKPIDARTIEDYVNKMKDILCNQGIIEDFFEPIASGAFKECYDLNSDLVIKFASECNDTEEEQALLQAADEAGVGEMFMPTWYCPLTSFHPELIQLSNEDSYRWYYNERYHTCVENQDYEGQRANYAIIQPRIYDEVREREYMYFPRNAHDYARAPITDAQGNEVEFRVAESCYVTSQTWLQDIVDVYGIEFFYKLSAFLKDNKVHDLHTGNIGYYKRNDGKIVPVIFDCLSACH